MTGELTAKGGARSSEDIAGSINGVNFPVHPDSALRLDIPGAGASSGRFATVDARNVNEAQFLANAETTFGSSRTWTSVVRHQGELVVQRGDIELSPQNLLRMKNGQAPFVRAADGTWEPLQLHHVGRETGQMIEVTRTQNAYNSVTGGVLHIPGPGGPVRTSGYTQSYWKQRYNNLMGSGHAGP